MEFTSAEGEQRYAALVRAAAETVVGLDFDGTLAPIVEDPSRAHIHPDAPAVLEALAQQVRAVAVVTGRPARQALDLGGLEQVGQAIGEAGLAVAVHTRRLPDPDRAFDVLLPLLTDLATSHDLVVEPGKRVVEVRSPGMHKGKAVDTLVEELGAGGFLFGGDDLGDVEAFEAVARLAKDGMPTLLVCSASDEQSALVELADVVVHGPEGVLELLAQLTRDAAGSRA
jgi:trehalose 6-phosphate phosphatase